MVQNAKIVPQSPTKVCKKCYDEANTHNNTRWLPWLECAQPNNPEHEDRITVVVNNDHQVIKVKDIPSSLSQYDPSQLDRLLCRRCSNRDQCTSAHSVEELEYWKWSSVQKQLERVSRFDSIYICHINYNCLCMYMQIPQYHTFSKRYSYTPDENSMSIVGLNRKLSPKNYISKFHKLVYLDEIAHCLKMANL